MGISRKIKTQSAISKQSGGGSGIRTHVTVSRKHAFQACAFSHSATPPDRTRFTGHISSLHQNATRAFALQPTFLTRQRPSVGGNIATVGPPTTRPIWRTRSLISIIVSCFQRLTPSGIAAQDNQQMQDISGRESPFCESVNDVSPDRQ